MASTALDIITGDGDKAAIAYWKLRSHSRWLMSGCIEWMRALNKRGYGVFSIAPNANALTHRVAWVLAYGPIPNDLCVLHRCDNPRCHNVDHLFLGTRQENLADMRRKDRQRDYSGCIGIRGEANANAKLSASQVLEIRAACATQDALSKQYGVSREHIRDIRARRKWVHLDG